MKDFVTDPKIVACCGMNCGTCIAYLRDKNSCCGCNFEGNKPKHCITCVIKNCNLLDGNLTFCSGCKKFPCTRMKQLDARYKKNYQTSLIENQKDIEEYGLDIFLENEKHKWTFLNCGAVLSVHRNFCLNCKTPFTQP